MTAATTCAKCGSPHLIPGVHVVDRGHYSADSGSLSVELHAHPEALLFRHTVRSTLSATICGECGYTEFFASEPERLLEAFRTARSHAPQVPPSPRG